MPTTVIVAPVYAAGEAPIEGATHDALVEGMRARGHRDVHEDRCARAIARRWSQSLAKPGDIVVCLGAGTITQWAYALAAASSQHSTARPAAPDAAMLDGEALLQAVAEGARPARSQCAARRTDLVPGRRSGGSSVHAGR